MLYEHFLNLNNFYSFFCTSLLIFISLLIFLLMNNCRCYFCLLFILTFFLNAQCQRCGCPDLHAINFSDSVSCNDGSCLYDDSIISASSICNLNDSLNNTSGLCYWNHSLWSVNDHGDAALDQLDTLGHLLHRYFIQNVSFEDVEDIAQDSLYFYIGDFGNNSSGNRTNLHILRLLKSVLSSENIICDTISFHYPNQADFSTQSINHTNFDCEAMIVMQDSIYLFSKEWLTGATTCYRLPNIPGSYSAILKDSLFVDGLITAADYYPDKQQVVLCGYSQTMQPFLYFLYHYPGHDFFHGNKRKMSLNLMFHQTEGIACAREYQCYISNESLQYESYYIPAQLSKILLTNILAPYCQLNIYQNVFSDMPYYWEDGHVLCTESGDYEFHYVSIFGCDSVIHLHLQSVNVDTHTSEYNLVFPNPVSGILKIESSVPQKINVYDYLGKPILTGAYTPCAIDMTNYPAGIYYVRFINLNSLERTVPVMHNHR